MAACRDRMKLLDMVQALFRPLHDQILATASLHIQEHLDHQSSDFNMNHLTLMY